MEKENKKNSVLTNMIWRFMERTGAQGVRFIVELVLARILMPDDYGVIALVTVFIEILNVFVDSGLANALIQKKDADDLDFSSVFYFNLVWCIGLYGILFAVSPFIASFYGRDILCPVIRVLGIQIIVSGVKNVQQAYVSRHMQFKRFFFATLTGTLGAACFGILLAIKGFGVWALVGQQLFNVIVDTIMLWCTVKWHPKLVFSFQRLKGLFSYGWKLLVSTLIDKSYTELKQLIIGKLYSTSDLSFYNRGRQFPKIIITNINSAFDSVLLPTMSNVQDDFVHVKTMTRTAIKTSTYIIAPMMIGLACISSSLVNLVLTEKWSFCVPFLRIFCITYMFWPIHTANLNAIKAMGRSDLFLRLEIIKTAICLVVLLITMQISVKAMAYSEIATGIMGQIINAGPNKKLLNYRYWDQFKDFIPNILQAAAMGALVLSVCLLQLSDVATLAIQIPTGIISYIFFSVILKNESFYYVLKMLKSMLRIKTNQ